MLPDNLRARRLALGWSYTDLAEHLGVDRQTLWRWEHEKSPISHGKMVDLALCELESRYRR